MSVDTISFILGGLFVAVALLGGGIEVHDLKIPPVGRISRLLSFIVGAVFIGLAIFLNPRQNETHSSAGNTTSVAPQPVKVEGSDNEEWLTRAQYQQAFDKHVKDGFYPGKVEVRCEVDSEQFHVEWKGLPLGVSFFSHSTMPKEMYESKNKKYVSKGYSL